METVLLAGIVKESITDGPGIRMTLFAQGCPHHCAGCHNPQTWPFEGGKEYTVAQILALFDRNPLLKGITFSGGEPFCQPQPFTALAREIHKRHKTVVCYTGYLFEDLWERSKTDAPLAGLLGEVDFLVDGPYLQESRDLTLPFWGSSNQRFLDVAKSCSTGNACLADQE